jgi:CspA family cold shock protein
MPNEESGTVKWFNAEKGFGFIQKGAGEKDVFVHQKQLISSGILRPLQEGEQVRFTAKDGPKGRSVVSVILGNAPG